MVFQLDNGLQTQQQLIMEAARGLSRAGHHLFTYEQLVVEAWRVSPLVFGLAGYEENYPNANKVLSNVHGKKGLVARGLLARLGRRLLQVKDWGS
jgi:hypothetical protein